MGSDMGTLQTMELRNRPALLRPTRSLANSPMLPPSALRVATTMSRRSVLIFSSMAGMIRSSCCKSASITSRNGELAASMPSTAAEANPRRPIRWTTRIRRSCCARERAAAAVAVHGIVIYDNGFVVDPGQRGGQVRHERNQVLPFIVGGNDNAEFGQPLAPSAGSITSALDGWNQVFPPGYVLKSTYWFWVRTRTRRC